MLRVLTDRFAAAESITVAKAEIDAFVASTAVALAGERAEAAARRDALKHELAAGKLPAERKAQVEREIASADPALAEPFWSYYRDHARHSFYQPGSRAEKAAFTTPPWGAR
ncbi:MAG: hypothetical protein AW08_03523 [Candidatus Accumulibacter adjunctus]|uniref:Uncharacterized protein n=1 Tax=Candidatus Accumulibacter adjunctus TaxID=1454001 RepID=A0A011NKZ4_9PROT|nr:MAG: hypothetical protein AW08_03523 [Candidatus Accumulibacter adjunctus]